MSEQKPASQPGFQRERRTDRIDFTEDFSTDSLKGQSVLITGGATGIGQDCAIEFAKRGAIVTIADINDVEAEKTVERINSSGSKAQFVKVNVLQWKDLVRAFKEAIAFGGGLDIVIPSAGISHADHGNAKWLETGAREENGDPLPVPTKVLAINAEAVFNTAHLAMYYFKQNPGRLDRSKQIIFVASMAGYSSMLGVMDYATSKWAVRGLFRSLRGAYRILGEGCPDLRCNLLAPGFILTPMTTKLAPMLEKAGIKMAMPADVTKVALRMASDEKVIGRAAAIASDDRSFDLCDDNEGLQAGRALTVAAKENKFGFPEGS